MAEGIEVRHARSCASRDGKRCNCSPGYRVAAYDAISKRKVSKTFRGLAEARRWRAGAQSQAAKGVRLAGTPQTLLEAAEAFVNGIATGAIRTKTGERYKPSVLREYERSLRLHVLPRSAARGSRGSSGAMSSALLTSCSPLAPTRARSATRSSRSRSSIGARSRTETSPSTRASGSGSRQHVAGASASPRRPRPPR
jgi:hypothetical protein